MTRRDESEGRSPARRRGLWAALLAALAAVTVVAAVAISAGGSDDAASAAAAGPVTAYPSPGTRSAAARTQISLRGLPADQIGAVAVAGSRSGEHPGELRPHSDGRGASFVPAEPFRNGERVTVRTTLDVRDARDGDFRFIVGDRPDPRRVDDAELPLPTLPAGAADRFRSAPDIEAPVVRITKRAEDTAEGEIMLAPFSPKGSPNPGGPLITDDRGDLVWFKPLPRGTAGFDLKVQELDGRRVLTWWEGRFALGWGYGEYVVLDESYREIARIDAANGYRSDLHDIVITPQGTALVLVYDRVRADLRSVGGPRDGLVMDNVVQEIDLETGLVLFEWHSLGQVPLRESRIKPQGRSSYDYFHVNSVEVDRDGDLIVSARNTCAIYKLDRETGDLLWTLGGKRTDFEMGRGTRFCFQHDARRAQPGVISLFDNAAGPPAVRKESRGILLAVDEERKTVRLVREYEHPREILAPSQGSTRRLPNGNIFVGWGQTPVFTEYSADGRLLFNGRMTSGKGNYRAVRADWVGRPADPPSVAAQRRGDDVAVWASWNGATEVARWEVLSGPTADALQPAGSAARDGFETSLRVPAAEYVAVRGLDAGGKALGTSEVVRPTR